MNITPYDLVVLHKNVDREVGNEIFPNKTLANNDMEIMKSIERLLKENLIVKTNEFDISINKKKLTDLKDILKENGIKTTGTKQVLINRIKDNLSSIINLELPFVYKATEKGEKILKETKYLLSFNVESYGYGVSVNRAYHLAENYISKDCNDKVAEIYKFELQNSLENSDDKQSRDLALTDLIEHYNFQIKDYANARKFLNILYYFNLKDILDELQISLYSYYYDDGDLNHDRLISRIYSRFQNIYEGLVFAQNLTNKQIFELFKTDTEEYNDLDDIVTEKFINYIIAMAKRENESMVFLELVDTLKNGYTIDKEKFDDEDDYYSNFITTNIATLKELDSQIEIEVDIRNGKLNFFIDDNSLESLIEKEDQ